MMVEEESKAEVAGKLLVPEEACSAVIQALKEKLSRNQVKRDQYGAHDPLVAAYFSEHPINDEATFRAQFRISQKLFTHNCTSTIRQMAYDSILDALDEYLQMGATTAHTDLVKSAARDESSELNLCSSTINQASLIVGEGYTLLTTRCDHNVLKCAFRSGRTRIFSDRGNDIGKESGNPPWIRSLPHGGQRHTRKYGLWTLEFMAIQWLKVWWTELYKYETQQALHSSHVGVT
ncbi:hypothetical protein Tco_0025524 [Tanacetum coccineum]